MKNEAPDNKIPFRKRFNILQGLFLLGFLSLAVLFFSLAPPPDNTSEKKNTASTGNIEYENFLFVKKESPLHIKTFTTDSVCTISIYNHYLENIDIMHISPQPFNIISDNGSIRFSFIINTPGDQEFIFKT